ncbi:hypothetical protein OIV83_000013 [Microbotryomycetes sp. JL201]|nr:hypothetical protein OIV83_000013 [Microbotryomycetes sp. JL201]
MTAPLIIPATPATTMQAGGSPTFYKRPLPQQCIAFSSAEGKVMFKNSLDEGNLDTYFLLAGKSVHFSGQFLTQNEPAYCGLGTLCMILNALEIDPQRKWRGPWRWYDQSMLDCCRPLEAVAQVGITLNEFTCLARCNGLKATVTSPRLDQDAEARQAGLAKFRQDLKRATNDGHGQGHVHSIMAISYSRKTLGQTGDGHFSPVGAYSEKDDMVLILDVARFKYPAYWIPVELAYDSMLPIDKATGQPRGYCMLSPLPVTDVGSVSGPLSMTTLSLNKSTWAALSSSLQKVLLALPRQATVTELLEHLASHLASYPTQPVSPRPTSSASSANLTTDLEPLLKHTSLYKAVGQQVPPLTTLFLLTLLSPRSSLRHFIQPSLQSELDSVYSSTISSTFENDENQLIAKEVEFLSRQLSALGECCRAEERDGAQVNCGCSGPKTASKAIAN